MAAGSTSVHDLVESDDNTAKQVHFRDEGRTRGATAFLEQVWPQSAAVCLRPDSPCAHAGFPRRGRLLTGVPPACPCVLPGYVSGTRLCE